MGFPHPFPVETCRLSVGSLYGSSDVSRRSCAAGTDYLLTASRRRKQAGSKRMRESHRHQRKEGRFLPGFSKVTALRRSEIPGSINRRFVRWVYFALNRRGLDLSGFRRHVSLCLSHFRFSLSALTGTCHVPVGIRQGKDHQRKSAGTPRLSRYFCLASSRSFSNSAVLYSV